MKCIYCQKDTKYKVRKTNGGRCESCNHEFAFDPKAKPSPVTDSAFQHTIDQVSGQGKLFFTENQLYYEFNRRLTRRPSFLKGLLGAVVLLAVLTVFCALLKVPWPFVVLISLLVGGASLGALLFQALVRDVLVRIGLSTIDLKINLSEFRGTYLQRWKKVHGAIPKLVDLDASRRPTARLTKEADITAYSFDRAVVTEHAPLAAMLIANNFHFENNCAILSLDGYPFGSADLVRQMLRRNPNLQVFVVHDATVAGLGLAAGMRRSDWFPEATTSIIDLGLRPSQAWLLRLPGHRRDAIGVPDQLRELLSPRETGWLERGRFAEAEAIRPARLIRSIFQGFSRARQMDPNIPTGDRPPARLPLSVQLATGLAGLLSFLPWIQPHSYAPAGHPHRQGHQFDISGLLDFDLDFDFAAPDSFG